MTFFHRQLKITWLHFILYCVLHYCTRLHLCYRPFITEVVMVVRDDTLECFVSQLYQIYLQNTFTRVLAAGFTVTGLKVQSLHCPSEITFVWEGSVSYQSSK